MKLFLIRHGETSWTLTRRYQGNTDIPLTAKGVQQARAIAQFLKRERLTYLYTSRLQRAGKTAQIIGRTLRLKPIADARLNEIDFGKWEGVYYNRLYQEGRVTFQKWREGKLRRPPGGESVDSLARRVGEVMRELLSRHSDETIALVSHGGPIKMFLFKVLKAEKSSIWSFRIDPASISLVEGNSELFQIAWTNRIDHLKK